MTWHRPTRRILRVDAPTRRRYQAAGVRRHGFHALSYASLMDEPARVAGAPGRVAVRLIRTDEEQIITRSVCRPLGLGSADNTTERGTPA